MYSVMQAVIPAAGLGTRVRPLSYASPKELLPVGTLQLTNGLQEYDDTVLGLIEVTIQTANFFGNCGKMTLNP